MNQLSTSSFFDEIVLPQVSLLIDNYRLKDQDEPPLDINDIDDDVLDKDGTRIKVRHTFLVPVFHHLFFTIFK